MSFIGQDPVRLGWATSWARPGGNVTGLVILTPELEVKRFELLLEAVPGARRVGVLAPRWKDPDQDPRLVALRGAAKRAGVKLVETFAAGPSEYPAAFSAMREAGVQALLIAGSPEFFRDGVSLAQLALDISLPTIGQWREMATQGCLLGYGPSFQELLRQTVEDYVVKIFHGAKPGDLPLAGPTRFEFAINGKTAQSLHLTLPPSVVLRADEVIN
jgi:putative ABC transport system substrate-binding protein